METNEEIFLGKIIDKGRVTVPYEIREKLDLKKGDFVKVKIRKDVKKVE